MKTMYLHLDGWSGHTCTPVEIVGETYKRFRIRATQEMRLPGRMRWLRPGDTTLVPKYSVTDKPCKGR
jgi:hypothetical protein